MRTPLTSQLREAWIWRRVQECEQNGPAPDYSLFRAEFYSAIDEIKADAWDEGQSAGISFQAGGDYITNPYRKWE